MDHPSGSFVRRLSRSLRLLLPALFLALFVLACSHPVRLGLNGVSVVAERPRKSLNPSAGDQKVELIALDPMRVSVRVDGISFGIVQRGDEIFIDQQSQVFINGRRRLPDVTLPVDPSR